MHNGCFGGSAQRRARKKGTTHCSAINTHKHTFKGNNNDNKQQQSTTSHMIDSSLRLCTPEGRHHRSGPVPCTRADAHRPCLPAATTATIAPCHGTCTNGGQGIGPSRARVPYCPWGTDGRCAHRPSSPSPCTHTTTSRGWGPGWGPCQGRGLWPRTGLGWWGLGWVGSTARDRGWGLTLTPHKACKQGPGSTAQHAHKGLAHTSHQTGDAGPDTTTGPTTSPRAGTASSSWPQPPTTA